MLIKIGHLLVLKLCIVAYDRESDHN